MCLANRMKLLSYLFMLSFFFFMLDCATRTQANSIDGSIKTSRNQSHPTAAMATYNTAVITAASPSHADVSAAIVRAKAGDTVLIPAGSATWSQQLEITKPINLIGAGIG